MHITKTHLLWLGILSFLLLGCSQKSDFKLEQSIFIEDSQAPGLPIYSEWGYNTFGGYIDRDVFRSNNSDLPIKIIANKDTLRLTLHGEIVPLQQYVSDKKLITVTIIWTKETSFPTHKELLSLNGHTIDLTDSNIQLTVQEGENERKLPITEGEIHIQQTRKLIVDNQWERTIISGRFFLKTASQKDPISVRNGRFDFGIGYENFFLIE